MISRILVRLGALVLPALALIACSPQTNPKDAATIAALRQRVSKLQAQVAQLKQQASSGDWVLWHEVTNSRGPILDSGISPWGAYSNKTACLQAAETWSLPGGKISGLDPYIVENKTSRLTLTCLPRAVTPYAPQ